MAAGKALRRASALCAGCWAFAGAFDIDAHDAIGQTTASAMDVEATRQVKRLMGGQDASDVAGWGHQADDTYPGLARLHFDVHDDKAQPFCGSTDTRVSACPDNICLLSAIKHFYGKIVADEGRSIDYPKIDYGKVEKGLTFSDVDSLKMLINLLGDLHQPMHVGYAGDNNGKDVKVKLRGESASLYEVWDHAISEHVRNEESNFWLGGWTHVRAVKEEFERDKEAWKRDGAFKTFENWAAESVKFACENAYKHPQTKKWLAGPNAEKDQSIDMNGYQALREMWLRQILVAGERTAIVLNDILDAKSAAKLKDDTSVKTKADVEKEKEKEEWHKENVKILQAESKQVRSSGGSSTSNFLTNLGIAFVTVPTFLLVVNLGPNPALWLDSAKSALGGEGPQGPSGRHQKRFE